MGSIITRAKKLRRWRYIAQTVTLAAMLAVPVFTLRSVCAPVFFCHSCPWATMACPIGVLINFSTLRIVPFITIGILGLVGTFGGRIICGWLCPFGLLQDLMYRIKTRKFRLPRQAAYAKYALLVGLVFAVPFFWPGKPYTYCNFCPTGTLESTIPWAFLGVNSGFGFGFYTRMAILAGTLVLVVLVSRAFCRVLCPLGALFSVFNRFSLLRFHLAHAGCSSCGACMKWCPTGMDPVGEMNGEECIRCMECTPTGHIKLATK